MEESRRVIAFAGVIEDVELESDALRNPGITKSPAAATDSLKSRILDDKGKPVRLSLAKLEVEVGREASDRHRGREISAGDLVGAAVSQLQGGP